MTRELAQVETPIGGFRAVVEDGAAVYVLFVDQKGVRRDSSGVHLVLGAYFAGEVDALDALTVAPQGTAFKQAVWKLLREVRAGTTVSYGELAARVGAPGAARAVGTANATNPICLIIPCHRVIRTGGGLGGYGFGLARTGGLVAPAAPALALVHA